MRSVLRRLADYRISGCGEGEDGLLYLRQYNFRRCPHESYGGDFVAAVGVKRVAAVVEPVICDKPAVVRSLAPPAHVYMGVREEAIVLVHQPPHALSYTDRKSTRLNSSHRSLSRMPSSA